ncbi:MAG TPA: sugar phosphate isomerase/epimerase family protein [Bryobacteraceae bacterium]
MKRRELLKALPVMAAATRAAQAQAQPQQPAFKGRLRPGVVAMSFRNQLETGKMTYEDCVRYIADLGLEGMDLTSYWVPPLLTFKPGIPSQQISEMVRQTPANPTNQWLNSLRTTAYKNNVPVYSVGSPVKMAQPTTELRQKEIAFAKKWIDIADRLGAGHVRVFGGGIAKGATEAQAVEWAVEVYKPALDYAGSKGIVLGLEDDDELTRSSEQIFTILKKVDHPFARINLDCGNFRKDGYKEVERCAPFAAATHVKTNMSSPEGKREEADWPKLFGILANGGYRGYVSIEMEPRDTDNPVLRYAPELIRCARMYSGG